MQKNNSENAEMLYQAILSLSSPEECRAFFQDLCTVAELRVWHNVWKWPCCWTAV